MGRGLAVAVGSTLSVGLLAACGGASSTGGPKAPAVLSRTAPGARSAVTTTGMAVPRSPGAQIARRVCGASSPGHIRRQYLPRATARASRAERGFLRTAAKPTPALRASKSYAYLVARVYAMSVAKSDRAGAYAGCAYELSQKESGR
jgi:hypothetical protein